MGVEETEDTVEQLTEGPRLSSQQQLDVEREVRLEVESGVRQEVERDVTLEVEREVRLEVKVRPALWNKLIYK